MQLKPLPIALQEKYYCHLLEPMFSDIACQGQIITQLWSW